MQTFPVSIFRIEMNSRERRYLERIHRLQRSEKHLRSSFRTLRTGRHPAVIISHGYNGCHADWVNEGKYYSEHGYVVYAYDFCGGSVSSRSSGESADMLVSSLAAVQLGSRVRALAMYFPALCVPDDWKKRYPDPARGSG